MSEISLESLYEAVEEKMKEDRDGRQEDVETQLSRHYHEMKLSATAGSESAREFTRNRIYYILKGIKDVHERNIGGILRQYHVNYFKNIYSGGLADAVRTPVDAEIEAYFEKYTLQEFCTFETQLKKLSQIIYQELYGFSILDELVFDGGLDEVACNRHDYIWIQYKGIKRKIPNPEFLFCSEKQYNRIIEDRIVSTASIEMNAGEPVVYSVLDNGIRVTAVRPPLSKYYTVNMRMFNSRKSSVRDSFITEKMEKILRLLVNKGRRNVAIIGEQGSGKTTAADEIIIRNLDDSISIGLAENIHELGISWKYPAKNVVELQYSKEFKPCDITEIFFRLNRDILIYGEVRSSQEAAEMIKAMLRQARGSMFTFHSSGVRRMIHDLRGLLMQTGMYSDYREAQFDVADAVDIVIHLKLDRDKGKRYVYKVSEIKSSDADMGFEVNDLFVYDKNKNIYHVNPNGISDDMKQSCLEYEMLETDLKEINSIFSIAEDDTDYIYMGQDGYRQYEN